jgi:electron transport complex protein RnfE
MIFKEFSKGIWKENPVLVQLLGLCPTLAVTTKVVFGFSMGLATTFVLFCSSVMVSLIRKIVPSQVRIAVFTVIIATFVTVADYFLKAYFPEISKSLGPYIPLIVVNCIILGRQEAFASKQPVFKSAFDALGMGIGFTLSLIVLAGVREVLAFGSFFGINIMPEGYTKWVIMALPAGAFLTLGILISIFNWINMKGEKRKS